MKKSKAVGIQYAALPYRLVGRRIEIMLITSRDTRRWIIPKGWPMKDLSAPDVAATEAAEEAGIAGEVEPNPIGSYRYLKRFKSLAIPTEVIVFPFRVSGSSAEWKEKGQRDLRWFRYARAAALVAEPSLKRLIREFGRSRGQPLLSAPPGLKRLLDKGLLLLRG